MKKTTTTTTTMTTEEEEEEEEIYIDCYLLIEFCPAVHGNCAASDGAAWNRRCLGLFEDWQTRCAKAK